MNIKLKHNNTSDTIEMIQYFIEDSYTCSDCDKLKRNLSAQKDENTKLVDEKIELAKENDQLKTRLLGLEMKVKEIMKMLIKGKRMYSFKNRKS